MANTKIQSIKTVKGDIYQKQKQNEQNSRKKQSSMDMNYVSYEPELYVDNNTSTNITTAGGATIGNKVVTPSSGTQLRNSGLGDAGTAEVTRQSRMRNSGYTELHKSTVTLPTEQIETVSYDKVEPIDVPSVEKVKTDLATFSSSLAKQVKYNKLSKNLTTLYEKTMEAGAERQRQQQKNAAWSAGIFGILGVIGTAINPIVGGVVTGLGALVTADIQKDANDTSYQSQAQKYIQLADTFQSYSETLENRDIALRNSMNSITGSMDEMRLNYGDAFVDQFYNLMLAKSGMTSDAYSLLTGNFKTYNQMQYGQESGEAGLYDELTQGNANLFSNMYAQLTAGDLEGIKASLTQALFSGNTVLGEQLRGYENDLSVALDSFLMSQESSVEETIASLSNLSAQAIQENIGYAEQLGGAQADRASSGFRGGTSTANEALARLYQDMGRIAGSARITNAIRNLRYTMEQQALNASSTAYNYRSSMRQATLNAQNQALIGFNNIGKTAFEVEQEGGNKNILNAQELESQAREYMDELDADETDIVLDSL